MKILGLITILGGITWAGLWFTPDQQGQRLMDRGQFQEAAGTFRDPFHQGVAWFRAGSFEKAEQAFARVATPEADFNRGNCLIMRGKYEAAIQQFDSVLRSRPDWDDAQINREIAAARAKLTEEKGGDMGDQKIGADEVKFDKEKNADGQDTETESKRPLSDSAMQELWLRRVQTKPAQFLKAKFAYQLTTQQHAGDEK